MAASPYCRFSHLVPAVQALFVQLLREEFTAEMPQLSAAPAAVWERALAQADPLFVYDSADEPTIRLSPESYAPLRAHLVRELALIS